MLAEFTWLLTAGEGVEFAKAVGSSYRPCSCLFFHLLVQRARAAIVAASSVLVEIPRVQCTSFIHCERMGSCWVQKSGVKLEVAAA